MDEMIFWFGTGFLATLAMIPFMYLCVQEFPSLNDITPLSIFLCLAGIFCGYVTGILLAICLFFAAVSIIRYAVDKFKVVDWINTPIFKKRNSK